MLRSILGQIARKIPLLKEVISERDCLRLMVACGHPPGHYYSPIPSLDLLRADEKRIWGSNELHWINLNEAKQLELFESLTRYYDDIPFTSEPQQALRYYFDNDFYSYSDGVFLYSMVRHLRPSRYIEVGSGYSSALVLDVNSLLFSNTINCTFIDPEPERLRNLLRSEDVARVTVIPKRIQDIDLTLFSSLKENDVLFIDSSHVAKTGSDLNHIIFQIIPRLAKGVYIHVHDIFWPFEYPKEYLERGWAWNEAYIWRAFLQHNQDFEIVLFTDFLSRIHGARLSHEMPLAMKHPPNWPTLYGASLWLQRVRK